MGSDGPCHNIPGSRSYFNPRSRVGSDVDPLSLFLQSHISIHAPAWGATLVGCPSDHCRHISIHAPAWGATGRRRSNEAYGQNFNPRSRVGSDFHRDCVRRWAEYFNPRSRVGSDESDFDDWFASIKFQSTLPRGERRAGCDSSRPSVNFNPRSRVGSDRPTPTPLLPFVLFQSTLPRGERLRLRGRIIAACFISIHAPAWGATMDKGKEVERLHISIHAPAWGAT